jgi:Icc-related predicted phosphoesterase
MPEIAVYSTDMHGEIRAYEHLLEIAAGKNVKAVIIGGDISPFLSAVGDIAIYQREFIQHYLLPRIRSFHAKTKKDIYMMMGNDDLRINMDILEKAEKSGLFRLMNQKILKIGNKFITGYSFVNETPFLMKDWEKPEDKMKKDLDKLAKKSDPKKTIYVMHAPPYGSSLDVIFSGSHVGSSAITDFIQEKKPYLTLHGHIHESPQMSGFWKENIGNTVSVNPGNQNILVFDVDDLKNMELLAV